MAGTAFVSYHSYATRDYLYFFFFFLMMRPPPRSTLFPYPTLFRSHCRWPRECCSQRAPGPPHSARRWPPALLLAPAQPPLHGPVPCSRPRQSPHVPLVQGPSVRSEEHTSELQSRSDLVCRLLLEQK